MATPPAAAPAEGGAGLAQEELLAACIVERDTNGDVMLVWSYPILDADTEAVVKERLTFATGSSYHKYKDQWINVFSLGGAHAKSLTFVDAFSVVVVTKSFNPEAWCHVAKIMGKVYLSNQSPLKVLEVFLQALARGNVDIDGVTWARSNYNDQEALLSGGSLREIIAPIQEDASIVWDAIVLKRRIVVFHADADKAATVVRCLPRLAWHRRSWDICRPVVSHEALTALASLEESKSASPSTAAEHEAQDLKNLGAYIVGTSSPEARTQDDTWDVFIDASSREILLSRELQNTFVKTNVHKDIEKTIAASLESGGESDFIRAVHSRTQAYIGKLQSLFPDGQPVSVGKLKEQNMADNMAQFLFSLAVAEGMSTK